MPSPLAQTPAGALESGRARVGSLWQRGQRYARRKRIWNSAFRAVSYLRSALWTIPFLAILLVLFIAPALSVIDGWLGWRLIGLGLEGARALHQTVITLTLSFVVFTFGSLLVAIQVASGQLTPRIIATALLRDNVVKYTVGLFVFTLVFAVMSLNRLETHVNDMVALTTATLGILCMAAFLFFIDYAARLLRPVSILARIGNDGLSVIDAVYPKGDAGHADQTNARPAIPDGPQRVVRHAGRSDVVLAVDLDALIAEAERSNGVIELLPQVGDFVANDEPLFVLHGGATSLDDGALQSTVAFGSERTMEQDPLFSFRIMVDIALKALSPAINDPTTAVLAIDQIHRVLRIVGKRQLHSGAATSLGGGRVLFRTPDWEDFVQLACIEIRGCGAGSIQISRRLLAMLDNLLESLPPDRHAPLRDERRRLELVLKRVHVLPEDLALALIPDVQGLGGSTR